MIRNGLITASLVILGSSAYAKAPSLIPVQGQVADRNGNATEGDVNVQFSLYAAHMGGPALYQEIQPVTFRGGHFFAYVGDGGTLDLSIFKTNDAIYMGIKIGEDPEMRPRILLASAAYAGYADNAGNAEQLGGKAAAEYALKSDTATPTWTSITGLPAGFGDGVDNDTTYNASTGLQLNGTTFSADRTMIESWARNVCFNTESELTAVLDSHYAGSGSGPVTWSSITGMPSEFVDGDDDTTYTVSPPLAATGTNIAMSACAEGQILRWSASSWSCAELPAAGSLSSPAVLGTVVSGFEYASTDTPATIPDNNSFGFSSVRYITSTVTIEKLTLDVEITHPNMGELELILISPALTTVTFYNGDDEGTTNLTANFGGDRPFSRGNDLSFYGETTTGTWRLQVIDARTGNVGQLVSWKLNINETWEDGKIFAAEEIMTDGTLTARGELRLERGADLVMTDTQRVETLRVSDGNLVIKDSTGQNSVTIDAESGTIWARSGPILYWNGNNGCPNSQQATLSPTCQTTIYSGSTWRNCSGSCCSNSQRTCNNTPLGKMLPLNP